MEILKHRFVEAIPDNIEPGIIYISGSRRTPCHLCVCGCGHEMTTPISPTDWQVKFDGESVSLSPSIVLWEFKCKSHYWIIKSRIRHSGQWNERQVQQGREREKQRKSDFYKKPAGLVPEVPDQPQRVQPAMRKEWIKALLKFFGLRR
jgi:hypothetical protein